MQTNSWGDATIQLSECNGVLSFSIPSLATQLKVHLPTITLPNGGQLVLGELILALSNFSLNATTPPSASLDVDIGLPAELNQMFGSTDGKPNLKLFNTYNPEQPDTSMVKTRLSLSSDGLSARLLSSPIAGIETATIDGKLWWVLDMGEDGKVQCEAPLLTQPTGTNHIDVAGIIEIVKPLKLPLGWLKTAVANHLSSTLANLLPNNIPLTGLKLIDNQGLNTDGLKKLWGATLPKDVVDVLDFALKELGKAAELLPNKLKTYLDFSLPSTLKYGFKMNTSGGFVGSLAVGKDDPPIKLLLPTGPGLVGITLHSISAGQLTPGLLGLAEVDGDLDMFFLPEIAASMALTASKRRYCQLNRFADITAIKPSIGGDQLRNRLDRALFSTRFQLYSLGAEGCTLNSTFEFPMPVNNVLDLAVLLEQFIPFFTNKSFFAVAGSTPQRRQHRLDRGCQLPAITQVHGQ